VIIDQIIVPLVKSGLQGETQPGVVFPFLSAMLELRQWIPLVAQYELAGRQIFDLNDSLVDMLEKTDVREA